MFVLETNTNEVFKNKEVPSYVESSVAVEIISQAASDVPIQPEMVTRENLSEDQEVETEAVTKPDNETKSVRGRRAKTTQSKAAEDNQEAKKHSEDPVISAPVRGRRGKKTETTAPSTGKLTSRNRSKVVLTVEEVSSEPTRGRRAKKVHEDQAEDQEFVAKAETESEQQSSVKASHEAPLETAVVKSRRGRKTKQEPEQTVSNIDQQDVPQSDIAGMSFLYVA